MEALFFAHTTAIKSKVVVHIIWAVLLILVAIIGLLLVGTVIFLENRNPEKTVAWLIILAVFPIIGFVIYLVLGRNARKRKLFRHQYLNASLLEQIVGEQEQRLTEEDVVLGDGMEQKKRLVRLLLNNAVTPLTSNNRIEVLTNGKEKFQALFAALESAQHHIHLEYYIFKDDEIGRDTQQLLVLKSRAGVKVRVILDGLGSRSLPQPFLEEMRDAGIAVQIFFPVNFPYLSSKLNFRNHRKIVIVDGRVGFLGGMNIGDEYLSRNETMGFWRDTHLQVEGQCVHMLQTTFLNDWAFITRQPINGHPYYPKPERFETHLTQIVASGPDSDWDSIRQVFFTALATAQHKVYIETPYFVPDESITMALKTAALSGLDVRLIVQGIPEYQLTYWATRSYFDELLQAGVKVYKYHKGILHAKVALIDDVVGIVGSANIDIRSFKLNFEISALLYNREIVARLEQDFHQDLVHSVEVHSEEYDKRPLSDRFKESGARLLSPLL